MQALLRYPRWQRRAIAQKWAWRSQAVQAAARRARPLDFETQRFRALDQARGQVLREGVTYRAGSVTAWCVRRAVRGRVNQVEILVDGRPWRRCSLRTAERLLRRAVST